MEQKKVKVHFECINPFEIIPMNEYDFLLILGNCLDNAQDAYDRASDKMLEILFIDKRNYLEVIISNPYTFSVTDMNILKKMGLQLKKDMMG